jgi:hypothetical protein
MRGIPATLIITDAFTESVKQQLKALQFSDYRVGVIPHPLASLKPAEVETKASDVVDQIVGTLLK